MSQNRESATPPEPIPGQLSFDDLPPERPLAPDPVKVRRAADRIADELRRALEGNYYRDAWYAHMARWDVEALLAHAEATLP